jgi:RNA polymerase sigma-70 factor (ECF subfamily)
MPFGDRWRAPGGADPESKALREALAGSVDAFEPLVNANAQRVIRLAYHFLGDWDEARDLSQEAFARAFLCLESYDPERSFGTWLCTIAARLATDRLRHRRVVQRSRKDLQRLAPRAVDIDAALSLKEALSHLTPRQRQAVVLCDLHGFTATEAAEIIGCRSSTVRVLRFLARARMKEILVPGEAGGMSAETVE